MRREEIRVVERLQPAPDCVELVVEFPGDESPAPGQFYMLAAGDGRDTYLPRPFSFYRTFSPRRLSFLFRVVGPGTQALAAVRARDRLQAMGPLGHGFPLPDRPIRAVLVGCGVGVPPLWSLGRALLQRGCEVTALIGAKTQSGLLGQAELLALGARVLVATDDGSKGHQGPVTELLARLLPESLYACGPEPMLRAVQAFAASRPVPDTYLALEAAMACGYGVCLGCAVERAKPDPELGDYGAYTRVCREGPVFRWDEVKL